MELPSADTDAMFEDAMQKLSDENYLEAVDLLNLLAKKNHVRAQVELGMLYVAGTGVKCSPKDAFMLFRSAAEQGDTEAQSCLGRMYLDGEGTEQSDRKAFKWISMAAEKDEPYALDYLGYMYYEGRGTEQSKDKALECFVRSAEQDDAEGAYNAGSVYLENGDKENAEKYFRIAAENDDVQSMVELGKLLSEKDREQSEYYFQQAYEAGEPEGLFHLALMHGNEDELLESAQKGCTEAINTFVSKHPDRKQEFDALYQQIARDDPEKESDYQEFQKIA